MKGVPWLAFDVKYTEERPIVNITKMRGGTDMFERAVLTKGIDWAYEREKRMIDYRGKPGFRDFPPEALRGVIYGARMSSEDRAFVDGLTSQREIPIQVYRAFVDQGCFRVNIMPRG